MENQNSPQDSNSTPAENSVGTEANPLADVLAKRLERLATPSPEAEERARQYEADKKRREMDERRWAWREFVNRRGQRYGSCQFSTFEAPTDDHQKAVAALQAYAETISDKIRIGQNVILFGPPGTGKDHLCMAISREAFRNGFTVAWANGQDLFAAIRDGMKEGTPERRTVAQFTTGDVLYLSDPLPPTGEGRQFQQETLFRIIDRCYSDLKPVWATLNVQNKQEAIERLGPQATDRLMHGALIIPCNWESARKPL
jgi:DNA replication protein DnaC